MIDFTGVMAEAQKQGWALIALDLGVDMTTPAGEAMANMLATFSQFERWLISQRTREALAVKRTQGVQLGRPVTMPKRVISRIKRERAAGRTLRQISDGLNTHQVPTAQVGPVASAYRARCTAPHGLARETLVMVKQLMAAGLNGPALLAEVQRLTGYTPVEATVKTEMKSQQQKEAFKQASSKMRNLRQVLSFGVTPKRVSACCRHRLTSSMSLRGKSVLSLYTVSPGCQEITGLVVRSVVRSE